MSGGSQKSAYVPLQRPLKFSFLVHPLYNLQTTNTKNTRVKVSGLNTFPGIEALDLTCMVL